MASHRIGWSLFCVVALVGGSVTACEDAKPSSDFCSRGEERACTCPDGQASTQACGAKHSWGVCVCGNVPAADSGTAGTGGAGNGDSGAGGASGTAGGDDDSGTAMGGAGGSDAADAGPDAGDAGTTPPAPWGPCTSNADCGGNDVCQMNGGTTSFCSRPCTMASDCPAVPVGSTSMLTCNPTLATPPMLCYLTCTLGQMCPTSMTCNILAGTCTY